LEEGETPDSYLVSSDKATFHLHGIINKENVFIWGSENPDASVEFMLHYGPFFFTEHTVTGVTDILELWLCCQLKEDFPGYLLFCQDGEPPDYHLDVREFLDEQLPRGWIGHKGHLGHQDPQTCHHLTCSSGVLSKITSSHHQCHSPWQSYKAESQM